MPWVRRAKKTLAVKINVKAVLEAVRKIKESGKRGTGEHG